MPKKTIQYRPSRLAENADRVFFYCPDCFQHERITVRTILKYRPTPDGRYEVDPDYLQLYLRFLSDKYMAVMSYSEPGYLAHISKDMVECAEINMEQEFDDADYRRYGTLVFKNAMIFCPNCGSGMDTRLERAINCIETGGCGGCGPYEDIDPPGCSLCLHVNDSNENLRFCGRCYFENSGVTDCDYCLFSFAREENGITMDAIARYAYEHYNQRLGDEQQ